MSSNGTDKKRPATARVQRQRNSEILHAFNAFLHKEASGGVLLLICAVIAVSFATIPGMEWFDDFWDKKASITIGDFSLGMTLRLWINDALMAVFFFVVGLEIKREMLVGQLSSIRRSVLPIMAAIGGMVVPALIYSYFNAGNPDTAKGWGIPMATDIAFAIGIISILGDRVPGGLKVFLTALAIVDDLGAIIVLAIFYPNHALHTDYMAYAGLVILLLFIFNRARLKNKVFYILPGLFLWYFTYKSGIHATISGVILAMMIPSKGKINEVRFQSKISYLLERFRQSSDGDLKVLTNPEQQHIIHSMHTEIKNLDPLMHRFESRLHPFVTFLIMPLFALANAGVALDLSPFTGGEVPSVSLGIFFGLLVGKPVGIFLASFLGIKLGVAARPAGITWLQLASVGILGGIGFTMSVFINGLAFNDPALTDIGKISILLTSALSATVGLFALMLTCRGKAPVLTAEQILPERNKQHQTK